MGNTTFTGAVRSENGFKVVSKDGTSGEVSTSFQLDGSGLIVTPVLPPMQTPLLRRQSMAAALSVSLR